MTQQIKLTAVWIITLGEGKGLMGPYIQRKSAISACKWARRAEHPGAQVHRFQLTATEGVDDADIPASPGLTE